jgi:YspA, cpYpsA-related SLOG family
MSTEYNDDEPPHASSPFDAVMIAASLYGYRPDPSELDRRPAPEDHVITALVSEIFLILTQAFADTILALDLERLLWSIVNVPHRALQRLERDLDLNEKAQKESRRIQDGSEVRSLELERLLEEGRTLVARCDTMEFLRDRAAAEYASHTGSTWWPREGSKVNRRALTSAMIDSRDFIQARRRAQTEVLLPKGPIIAFSGGTDFNDHGLIWSRLDQVHAKYPDMVLVHGGGETGAERIASRWAEHRNVPQVPFKPDWAKHPKRVAPFKRNDAILQEALPIGVIIAGGGGIQQNLADKARKLGVDVWEWKSGA